MGKMERGSERAERGVWPPLAAFSHSLRTAGLSRPPFQWPVLLFSPQLVPNALTEKNAAEKERQSRWVRRRTPGLGATQRSARQREKGPCAPVPIALFRRDAVRNGTVRRSPVFSNAPANDIMTVSFEAPAVVMPVLPCREMHNIITKLPGGRITTIKYTRPCFYVASLTFLFLEGSGVFWRVRAQSVTKVLKRRAFSEIDWRRPRTNRKKKTRRNNRPSKRQRDIQAMPIDKANQRQQQTE